MKDSDIEIQNLGGEGQTVVFIQLGDETETLRRLKKRGLHVIHMPGEAPISVIKHFEPSCIVFSDGCSTHYAKEAASFFFRKVPMVGVGAGQRVIVEALGGEVEDDKVTERGALYPSLDNPDYGIQTFAEPCKEVVAEAQRLAIHYNEQDNAYF